MSPRPDNGTQCINHPQRAAVENCEVCGEPLCNYCLYYTDDGQRLCEVHAHEAAEQGLGFNPPETYEEGLIKAQARAAEIRAIQMAGEQKGVMEGPPVLYKGNNTDVIAFVGMMASLFGVISLCGGGICIPVVGALLSVTALINAKDAVDKSRARVQGIIGLLSSGVLLLLFVGVAALCWWSIRSSTTQFNNLIVTTQPIPSSTPLPTRTRAPIETLTPTPETSPEPTDATQEMPSVWRLDINVTDISIDQN